MSFLQPLYTADEMRAAEAGHDVAALMERAGSGVADWVLADFPDARRIVVVCGGGANGGDGRIAVRILRETGRDVLEGDDFEGADLIVDALFGTGFHGAPRPEAAALIERMNGAGVPIVSVDIASGVDASTGETPGAAVRADLTVTFHGEKVGHLVAPGRFHTGTLELTGIGLSHRRTEHTRVMPEILSLVPRRGSADTKYTSGSVLLVGGSPGMTGAVCLAAEAAFRSDAGYVAVAAPREALPVIETRLLEAVKRPLDEVWDAVGRATALALGPGLGRGDGRQDLVRRLLVETDRPAVVDADGLFELEPFERSAPTVLTPHAGELARLLGEESAWVDAHRLEALRRTVERFGCVVVLKGADTLIGAPGEEAIVHDGRAHGLATAGTGDVLTGIVAAFLGKGMEPRLAAAAGVVAHHRAAMLVPHQVGMIASDVVAALPRALA